MKQINRKIHANAKTPTKKYANIRSHSLANSLPKPATTDAPTTQRQSIQVQYIARKGSASRNHQGSRKKSKKYQKRKQKWIINKYFSQNRVGSAEPYLSEPDQNGQGTLIQSTEQIESQTNQDSKQFGMESSSAEPNNELYPYHDQSSSKRPSSGFGQLRDLKSEKKRKRATIANRPFCLLCLVLLIALLLAGLAALLVGLLARNTTTSTTTTSSAIMTTTRLNSSCSSVGRGTLLLLSGLAPVSWTNYSFNYTATNSSHTISFGFQNENNREYYLDQVSIVATNDTATELLINPNFENSTVTLTGWTQACTNHCSGSPRVISGGSICNSGNCYVNDCEALSSVGFLEQVFSTIIGQTYSISFMLLIGGSGTATDNRFFVDIL